MSLTSLPDERTHMQCTGERFIPEIDGDWTPEHKHRYALVAALCKGKDVLDVASGEGYGSAHLASVARKVIGVDISGEAVEHAQRAYKNPNLSYRQGSATDLAAAGLEENSFDVVVSFETIEHLHDHDAMLDSLCRVLRPDGLLIISSPDKREYTDIPNYHNEYHVHELYREEFEKLLSTRFPNINIYGQRLGYGSLIVAEATAPFVTIGEDENLATITDHLAHAMYYIAIASHSSLPVLPHSFWKRNIEQSDFAKHWMQMGKEAQDWINTLEARIEEQAEQMKALADEAAVCAQQLHLMTQSKSCKITKPLRAIFSFFRQLRR